MKSVERTQKAVTAWTALAVVLALEAARPVARAFAQTSLIGADDSTVVTNGEVPFKIYRDYAIVAQGSAGARNKLNFLIDTGSSSTVVDTSLARKLRLARSPRKISVLGSTVGVEEAVVPSLGLGPLQVGPFLVVVQDLSCLQEALSVRIDAIVGIDILSRSSFTVDYDGGKLIRGPLEPLSDSVTFDPHFAYPTVPLRISDRTLLVFVDTGAQELALFENRTGAILGTEILGQETRTTIKGQVAVKTVELQEVSLGTTHWAKREGTLMQGSVFDGTPGPKWLGAKRIEFDFDRRVFSWKK